VGGTDSGMDSGMDSGSGRGSSSIGGSSGSDSGGDSSGSNGSDSGGDSGGGCGGGSGALPISAATRDKAVMVLQDLLRCAYDAEAWEGELEFLQATSEGDILGCVDRVAGVLDERVRLFTQLRGSLGAFKEGLRKQAAGGGA
jgi:hypothetical protein